MSEAEQMIAALDTIEAGLQQPAEGVTTFTGASQTVSRVAYSVNRNEQFQLEQTIGRSRLVELIMCRMRTLGLDSVLKHACTRARQARSTTQ